MPMTHTLRRRLAALLVAALAPALACSGPALRPLALPITILVDSGPFGSIEAAADGEATVEDWDDSPAARSCTEGFAATELRRFLAGSLGVREGEIRLARPDRLPPAGDVFVLASRGSTPLLASLLPRRPSRIVGAPEGFSLRALRRGGRSVVVVAGHSRTGTLYGTYALLESLGMRFYGLGDTGTVYPPRPLALPRRMRIDDAPRFRTRGFWAFEPRGHRDFFLWMARNRMNLWTAEEPNAAFLKKLGLRLTAGGHSVQADYLDPGAPEPGGGGHTRFAAHPEWYGVQAGRRRGDIVGESGTNVCTSNAEARRELARNLVRDLAAGRLRHADIVQVWPLDGGRWCDCDSCRAQGTPTDRWLDLVAAVCAEVRVARAAGSVRRPVEVVAPAYLETLAPPTRPVSRDLDPTIASMAFFPYFRCYAHALADTSCTEINVRLLQAYRGWAMASDRFYRGRVSIGEYYNVSWVHSLPVLYASVMGADLPWYVAHGADGLTTMHAPTRRWGAWTLNHAVLARLLWNPAARADSVLARFCRAYFGAAEGPMRAHYAALERATANITALAHCVGAFGTGAATGGRLGDTRFPLFPLLHLQPVTVRPPANEAPDLDEIGATMRQAGAALDAARAVASDPLVLARLADEGRRFAYGQAMFDFWLGLIRVASAHRSGDAGAARRAWPAVESAAARLRAVHDEVQVAGSHADARDGLEASKVTATYEYFRRRYGR